MTHSSMGQGETCLLRDQPTFLTACAETRCSIGECRTDFQSVCPATDWKSVLHKKCASYFCAVPWRHVLSTSPSAVSVYHTLILLHQRLRGIFVPFRAFLYPHRFHLTIRGITVLSRLKWPNRDGISWQFERETRSVEAT